MIHAIVTAFLLAWAGSIIFGPRDPWAERNRQEQRDRTRAYDLAMIAKGKALRYKAGYLVGSKVRGLLA